MCLIQNRILPCERIDTTKPTEDTNLNGDKKQNNIFEDIKVLKTELNL